MSFRLIVNADDFGITQGVNQSIVDCHLAGSVTSTTLMANMDATEHAAMLAHQHPTLGVGLHFNLTSGRPLSDIATVRSLVGPSGEFHTRHVLLQRAFTGRLPSADIERELLAQFGRIKALGLRPTHFDSHQHVHSIPQVFRVVSRIAAAEHLPLRLPLRWPGTGPGKSIRRRVNELVLDHFNQRCLALKPVGLVINDGLCSVFDLEQPVTELNEQSYARLLDVYSGGVIELMVHPAIVDDALRARTAITLVSGAEDKLLRKGFLQAYVRGRQGRMCTYDDLAHMRVA